MKLKFTNHAKIRITERKIKISDIKLAIEGKNTKFSSLGENIVVSKKLEKVTIEVVYKKVKKEIIIITAYYL